VSDYHSNLFYSEEDGGYIADIPDLKSCSAFGETPEEALHEVQLAKAAWLQTCRARKKTVPPPRYRPATYAAVPAQAARRSVRRDSAINSLNCSRAAYYA
jgi:predicted RNase H-like HicB family nuclease